ncbi:hypothetical protein BU25DRAFT_458526 [Macroventuria anomochaeta]|uniref:Uncharacterized protein n=1 Tax=Macroventuria anomochaeta TaxID=301207 RepID=A0ACB6S0G1_9PLEO|nr:uncharacterized protein BU25DRAFT_458526 [Macroventuria anomochaeta]KAF2627641.1 hypothetical protein BU25DRAFT_458526 [Macroventuria anomochaeta]
MTELDRIQWNHIGMPFFDELSTIHRFAISFYAHYLQGALDGCFIPELDKNGEYDDEDCEVLGLHRLCQIIFSHPIFNSSPKGFVLQHNNLDLQNILVDNEGNFTGIINWDASLAMPRCVDHVAVPRFLKTDWYPGAMKRHPYMGWRAPYYRKMCAAAMVEAGNSEAKYTVKSALYKAAIDALKQVVPGDLSDVLQKLVFAISDLRLDLGELSVAWIRVGRRWELCLKKN